MKKSITTITVGAAIVAAAVAYTLACAGKPAGESTNESFAQASSAIDAGNFEEAIARLGELIDSGEASASTYYNLGVAQHRAGLLGQAILNYERAAALDPNAADIRANLERARKDSALVETPAPWPLRLAKLLSASSWSAVGATGFFALGLLAIGRALRLIAWPKSGMRAAAAAAILATTLPAAALAVLHDDARDRAIVTAADASLRVSPFEASKSITSLTPGRSLRTLPERQHGRYHLAELDSGQTGWVKDSEFSRPSPITTK